MNEPFSQMRDIIMVTESLNLPDDPVEPEPLVEATEPVSNVVLLAELAEVVFKLRAFMESSNDGEFAFGVETGMQRAADMIENVIRRHIRQGDELG